MKFNCDSKTLLGAVQTVNRVMASKTTVDILEGILLETEGDMLIVTATDGNMTTVCRIPANVEIEGLAVMPGKLFRDIVNKLPDGKVSASLDVNYRMQLKAAGTRTTISGRSADEFPKPKEVDSEYEITLPQPVLKDMIGSVTFAIPNEDTRKILEGGFLNVCEGVVDLVGLDGFRMAMRTQRISDTERVCKAIIPKPALQELANLMQDDEEQRVKLLFGKNRFIAETGTTTFYSALIQGTYIDYRKILPKSFNTSVIVKRDAFARGVERVALIATQNKNNMIRFDISDDKLLMTASNDVGDVREELDAETSGGPMAISFNVNYINSIAKCVTSDEISLNFGTNISPCIIKPKDGDEFTYLLLPIRMDA